MIGRPWKGKSISHLHNFIEADPMRSPKTPLASATESYARHHAARHTTLTRRTYGGAFARFSAFVGDPTIGDLNAENVNRYVASCGIHRHMARGDTAALKSLSKWMVRAGIFPTDPLAAVITPKTPKSRARPLDDRLIPQLLKASSETMMGPRARVDCACPSWVAPESTVGA